MLVCLAHIRKTYSSFELSIMIKTLNIEKDVRVLMLSICM